MPSYIVTLTFPRQTKQPIYVACVDSETRAGAELMAVESAHADGWKGQPLSKKTTLNSYK